MPRSFTSAQIANKNALESTVPWVDLLELEIVGAPAPLRFVNNVEPLTFHGEVFERAGFAVPWLPENSQDRLQRVQAKVQNVTRELQTLLELYWAAGAAQWTVRIWKVLWSHPDDTPRSTAETYEVLGAQTDLREVTFEMRPAGVTGGRVIPGRGFTATGGFPNLPR